MQIAVWPVPRSTVRPVRLRHDDGARCFGLGHGAESGEFSLPLVCPCTSLAPNLRTAPRKAPSLCCLLCAEQGNGPWRAPLSSRNGRSGQQATRIDNG